MTVAVKWFASHVSFRLSGTGQVVAFWCVPAPPSGVFETDVSAAPVTPRGATVSGCSVRRGSPVSALL
ncbi:hypothetical protein GCM10010121_045970 [Streptomyces brasiliensis]|uniref:Uncharacterized protein n=1 Tax=Streptomyces brasiliensis TaxID=1954 RepID=A0A917KXE3_9ACTN|nr:hypothetical protein GCM10010121_045970 [Streptomyces brasiliensis]